MSLLKVDLIRGSRFDVPPIYGPHTPLLRHLSNLQSPEKSIMYISYEAFLSLFLSYLHGCAYFEYVSCLVKVIFTFVCGFIERLAYYFTGWAK
jgi:hypothetical protein